MPASRAGSRKPSARGWKDDHDDVAPVGGREETLPEPTPIRTPTIGGIAKAFEREARIRYPLGDTRRVTNLTALRANMSRWHKQDGIPLGEIEQAVEFFWAGVDSYVREDGEPWRRFINIFARVHAKATAPDITDPAYYSDQNQDNDMDMTAEAWIASQLKGMQ